MPATALPLDDELNATASLLRTIDEKDKEIEELKGAQPQRPRTELTDARAICKVVTYSDLHDLIAEADLRLQEKAARKPPGQEGDIKERDRLFKAFKGLVKLIPSLKARMDSGEDTSNFVAKLQNASRTSRSDDFGRIRNLVADFINKVVTPCPNLCPTSREGRGFGSDTVGFLLCPIEFDWANPIVRANIRAHAEQYEVSNLYTARCFYEDFKGEADDIGNGFLKSFLLVQVYLYIFTSPSSMFQIPKDLQFDPLSDKENHPPPSSDPTESDDSQEPSPKRQRLKNGRKSQKATVAKLARLTEVTPESIAHAAVMLHSNLSDRETWSFRYFGIDYRLMYNYIVDYFKVDKNDKESVAEITALRLWWNEQVFPGHAKERENAESANASVNKIAQQRAARAAAVASRAAEMAASQSITQGVGGGEDYSYGNDRDA